MQKDKNKWVEDVLGSADQMMRAQSPDMMDNIMSRIDITHTSSTAMWRIAASVILLLCLNISTIYVYNSYQHSNTLKQSQEISLMMGLGADSHQADMGTIFFGN